MERLREMDKRTAVTSLHAMMDTRMFGENSWLADRDACISISAQLISRGLQVESEGTYSTTVLGKAVELDLAMVFVGIWDEWEVPCILEKYDLIDESDAFSIYDQLEDCEDSERVLRPWVQKAYFDHFNPSGRII